MQRVAIEFFVGKPVKLVLDKNFILLGIIEELYDDCLLFKTMQKTSLITFSKITEIVLSNGEGGQ